MHALVIDDSRAIRLIIGRVLKEIGFQVTEAGSGREGLERLGEMGHADLALVDWNMPEMNGLEFVRAVRADQSYEQVPIMMVSTETEMEQMVTALDAGANEYLMKPFTKEMILDKLTLLGISVPDGGGTAVRSGAGPRAR